MLAARLAALCALGAPISQAYRVTRLRQAACPMDWDVPLEDKQPSPLHIPSVANFLLPRVQDAWWTEARVEEFMRRDDAAKFRIGPSKIAGCGVIAARPIQAGEPIGTVWIKDPEHFDLRMPRHFTPWYGRAVNHCNHPNTRLEEDAQGAVRSVATRDIAAGEEVTGDYNEAKVQFPLLVDGAPSGWTC
mmetsp:Transcript_102513/g.319432  ORF Transcript_102513/g.319432 Transcript_102513/m.319432 type:complete len:189 (-) Transcript_102513:23-589(-)